MLVYKDEGLYFKLISELNHPLISLLEQLYHHAIIDIAGEFERLSV